MTEMELRQKVVAQAKKWLGYNEKDGSFKKIIDIYNNHKPLARGYKVKYTDAWCATYVSAVAIECDLTEIIPTECSCSKMIEKHKKLGTWVEQDSYIPNIGDILMYDWEDSGSGDNTGSPNHVGIVVNVTGDDITVIEGNKGEAVAYRVLEVNGKFIRGYCVPDYQSKVAEQPIKEVTPTKPVQNYKIHTVVRGDSLWAISKKYLGDGSRWSEISKLNGLRSTTIHPGQKLKIPIK